MASLERQRLDQELEYLLVAVKNPTREQRERIRELSARPASVTMQAACARCRAASSMQCTQAKLVGTPLPLRCDCGGVRYVQQTTAKPG